MYVHTVQSQHMFHEVFPIHTHIALSLGHKPILHQVLLLLHIHVPAFHVWERENNYVNELQTCTQGGGVEGSNNSPSPLA